MEQPARPKAPPAVRVLEDDELSEGDARAWAREYVNLLLTLEGVALVPASLPSAS
jgi:hypothetical protein